MKKVLSVLLAAAMVMGMSVSAMADKVWGTGAADVENDVNVATLTFADDMIVVHNDGDVDVVNLNDYEEDEYTFIAGDVLYFAIQELVEEDHGKWVPADADTKAALKAGTIVEPSSVKHEDGKDTIKTAGKDKEAAKGTYSWKWSAKVVEVPYAYKNTIDADWTINVKDNNYVSAADFATYNSAKDIDDKGVQKYVKVTLDATYDNVETDDVDFYFYIADTANHVGGKRVTSAYGEVHYLFDNWTINYVDFDYVNDVDHTAKWAVKEGDKGVATFSFNNDAYFVVKMISEEEVIFNFETLNYVKAIEKAFDYEAEYTTYNFKGESDEFVRAGELVIAADDESFIYGWDGEALVEIEATYVEDYKFDNGKKVDGWVIETNELGYYVVSDTEAVIEAAEEVETEVEAEKANPETGAADFVGAAVAMAVVSVAAAGALALKK